ncbi:lipoate--protein ligase [Malassezia sp. CBS 17886]|nr:lipoate--protein ligase [Malassezia sp. CBS 17886]
MASGALRALHSVRPQVHLSTSLDPHVNLAWEDVVLRGAPPTQHVCFLYRNAPCVVVGRNQVCAFRAVRSSQNLWSEVDPRAMQHERVPLVRRRSGGGSVYHDPGNVNFSFHMPKAAFARRTHTELVAHALQAPPLSLPHRFGMPPVFPTERNDLAVLGRHATSADPGFVRKVSGNAYKLTGKRAYHHGTLLVAADVRRMRLLRRPDTHAMETSGVASVASPVANLAQTFPAQDVTCARVVDAVALEFQRVHGNSDVHTIDEASMLADARLAASVRELRSWEWVFGASPDMSVRVRLDAAQIAACIPPLSRTARGAAASPPCSASCTLHLHVHRGKIARVHMDGSAEEMECALQGLVGVPYDCLAAAPLSVVGGPVDAEGAGAPMDAEWAGTPPTALAACLRAVL